MRSLIHWTVRAIVFLIPWMARLCGVLLWSIATTAVSLWLGVPIATNRMATRWTDNAARAGVSIEYSTFLYQVHCVIAVAVILLGWLTLSHIIVFLVNRVINGCVLC